MKKTFPWWVWALTIVCAFVGTALLDMPEGWLRFLGCLFFIDQFVQHCKGEF